MWEAEGGGDRRSILGSGTIAAYITGVATKGDHTATRLILGPTCTRSYIGTVPWVVVRENDSLVITCKAAGCCQGPLLRGTKQRIRCPELFQMPRGPSVVQVSCRNNVS